MAARTLHLLLILSLISLAISLSHAAKPEGGGGRYSRTLRPEKLLGKEKLTRFTFYFHDIVSGPNPTAVPVVRSATTIASSTAFGLVVMMDNPLTVGPNFGSKLVGRAQGIYAAASQTELSFLMVYNLTFMEGKYNGSNLSVMGRNSPFSAGVREMPVVGGTGLFRFARGFARATTHRVNTTTGDAVVKYNVYVFHY